MAAENACASQLKVSSKVESRLYEPDFYRVNKSF